MIEYSIALNLLSDMHAIEFLNIVPPNNQNAGELASGVFIDLTRPAKVSKRRSTGADLANRLILGRSAKWPHLGKDNSELTEFGERYHLTIHTSGC